jgi:predicted TIM-barrel fold metal-dependent hydrolase
MNKLQRILRGEINPLEARMNSINELVKSINTAPEFFIGFGACPFGLDIKKTSDWIEKYIIGNNMKGIGEVTLSPGNVLTAENIFRYIHENQKKLPVWIHTFNPLSITDIKEIIELAGSYNTVKVILGHGGGSNWLDVIDLIQNKPNIYMDISASFTILSIKYISEMLPDRCVFSSDLPYGDPYLGIKQIEYVIKDKHIRDNVLGLNTKQLLEM